MLFNITIEAQFDYRILYRLTSWAICTGGHLELCNEDIAIFNFAGIGIVEFVERLGLELSVRKTSVSQWDSPLSKVNVRFYTGR